MLFYARILVLIVAGVATVWGGIGYGVHLTVARVVERDAIDKATHWGTYISQQIPDLDRLVATGTPDEAQQTVIRNIRKLGDIFRFKLFDTQGRLTMVSDDSNLTTPIGVAPEADLEPLLVIESGIPIVEVFDGTAKPNRPDLYAEAYIPLNDDAGRPLGVVEVYVDQATTSAYFEASFQTFGLLLTLFFTTVFAIPSVSYALQRHVAEKSRRNAEYLASFDPLTGLFNRRQFFETAANLRSADSLSAICYLDVDRFKSINDKYGHAVGDAFLTQIADVLRAHCGPKDLVARFGGDEFVFGFRKLSTEDAINRVRRIQKDCAQAIEVGGSMVQGTISVGIASTDVGETLEDVLNHADTALYHAKSSGPNDFAVYGDAMGEKLRQAQALEQRVRDAAADNSFDVYYQPLVDGRSFEVVGHEALLRLNAEDGTPIPPDKFIPLAEEFGLIDSIGAWVLHRALNDMARRGTAQFLAINLSAEQFRSGELAQIVREVLETTGFPAHQLELEITESLLIEDGLQVGLQIDALKELGVSIAMDDFGTGFSSLSYLWKYGFDRVKVDKSFVAALEKNPKRAREIIESILILSDRLGMRVTAEGVETADQSQLLSRLGCDVLQGYHFGKPQPLASQDRAGGADLQSTASGA